MSDLYIPRIGPHIYIFPAAEYADRSWEYINRTQKHECRNWGCDRVVPFLGIFVSNFRFWFFAVHTNDRPGVEVPVLDDGPPGRPGRPGRPAGPPSRPGRHQDAQEPQGPHLRSAAAQFRLTSLTPPGEISSLVLMDTNKQQL
jgi:hypothetical protein